MIRFLLGASIVFLGACTNRTPLPKTYPAGGTVAYKGGVPMSGGVVLLNSADDPMLRVMGPIGADGRFTLTTVKDDAKADGAPAGQYKATILLPMARDTREKGLAGHKGELPIVLPQAIRIEERDANSIAIELPSPPPRP